MYFFALSVFFMFSATGHAVGQDIYSQRDTLREGEGYFVQRNFQYQLSRRDTVRHGKYELFLKPHAEDTLLTRNYDYEHLQLIFREGEKNGPFLLRLVSFYPVLAQLDPEGGSIQIPYTGTSSELRGQYEAGNPVGQWFFSEYRQEEGKAADTVRLLNTFFNQEGTLNEQFRIIEPDLGRVLSGSFNEEGRFDSVMVVRSSREEEEEVRMVYSFEDGLLTSITGPGGETIQPAYITGNLDEVRLKEHALDSLFAKVLSYYLPEMPAEEQNRLLRPLRTLVESFVKLQADSSVLVNEMPVSLNMQLPTVQLPMYEPEENEIAFIQETYNKLFLLQSRVDSLMSISAFSLNRYGDRELAALYARAGLLLDRISRQRQIFRVLSGALQQHINPEWFVSRRLDEISLQDTVTYTYNDELLKEEVDFDFEKEGLSPFEQYQAYVREMEEMTELISSRMTAQLQEQQLDVRLEERGDQITALSEEIERLADSLQLNLYSPEISRTYKRSFVEFKEELLQQYGQMSSAERVEEADGIILCLERLAAGLLEGQELAQNEQVVDQAYMDSRLNPYTYTEMRVRLFEKLFRTYRQTLVPYLADRMLPAENCEDFLRKAANLEVLQNFMLEALTKNTGRLERKIRPQDSPETIIRKLGIPVFLK